MREDLSRLPGAAGGTQIMPHDLLVKQRNRWNPATQRRRLGPGTNAGSAADCGNALHKHPALRGAKRLWPSWAQKT